MELCQEIHMNRHQSNSHRKISQTVSETLDGWSEDNHPLGVVAFVNPLEETKGLSGTTSPAVAGLPGPAFFHGYR